MTESKSPSSRLDDATEAWLQEIEKTHGPGWARICRTMANWAAYEELALRFYRAIDDGRPPPEIRDGIQRHYAYVMGSAVAQRNKAVADNHGREYERVHERAISSIHGCVNIWRTYRDALGMPLESSRDAVEAAYLEQRARGGWATPPRSPPSPRCG